MKNLLASAAMFFAAIILALSPISSSGQTSVTISNAVQQADIPRFGFNMGGDAPYGQGQILKSFNPYGYMQSAYWQTSWPCNAGGTVDTTHWYNSATDTGGYPANFFVGATYIAVSAMNGTSYGTGTITASTANTGSTGIDFTLGTPLSAACSTAQQDMLIVKFTKAPTGLISPQSFGIDACSGATWNTSDTSPASSNTTQSLQLPTACNVQFGSDESVQNLTNTNSSLAPQGVGWINLNGTYTFTFKAKCPVSACSLAYTVGRQGGTTYLNSSVTPTVNVTPKAGWNTYSFTFSAAETGAVTEGTLQYQLSSTGTVLVQDMDVIEGSTLPGNTTAYRDSVVRKLQALKPGSLRFMDGGDWCSDVSDMLTAGVSPVSGAAWQVQGNNRACGMNTYVPAALQVPLGYTDKLQLCVLVDADCWLTIGQFNLPSDWTTLINWLSSQGWISTFAASGHKIYLEEGNEAWNSGATGGLWAGGGTTYGYFLGPNMAAARAANGYNSSVIKLVGNNGLAGGVGTNSWLSNVLTVAQRTPNGLPDVMDQAAYTLNDLTSINTSGSNVVTTGAPFLDEWAEISNLNTHTLPSNPSTSVYHNCQWGQATFGVACAIYEANTGTGGGSAISQLQLDQVAASVGEAIDTAENFLLMQRDGGVTGPINTFQLAQNSFSYNCFFGGGCISGVVAPIWGIERYLACGPGQLDTCTDVDRPISIALQVVNNAIGSNSNLMSITQSGTPTFSYAGGQPWGGAGTNSIAANAVVPYVNCFSYSNGSGKWTTICFNNNLTTAETVTLAGAGAPTGSVIKTTFPSPSNLITDHNENTYLGASSVAPVVAIPTPTTTSGATYTIPPASFIALTYSTTGGSNPTAATPTFSVAAGTYTTAQTVAISDATAGTTIYYTTNGTTPTTASTKYTAAIAVSATETLEAIAFATGYTNSSVAAAAYTIDLVPQGFTLGSSLSALSVTPSTSETDTISVKDTGGFTGSVTLVASGLPSGVSAVFGANPTTGTSVLTLTASATAAAGTSTITVTGKSGTLTATTAIALTVTGSCVPTAITPYLQLNGGAWQQASTATVASGSNVNLGPWPDGGTWSWTGPGGFASTARQIEATVLNAGVNTYVATYTNAAACKSSQTFTLTVPSGSFNLSPAAPTKSIAQSASGTDTISVKDAGGFTGSVTLAASGLPSGVTAVFGTNPTTGTSVLTLTASATAAAGTATITITGKSGTLTATTAIALTVTGSCVPTAITPYLQVNGGAWQQASTATVASGSNVNLGPWPDGGTWSWTGPGGFTSTARQIGTTVLNAGANTYVATYTNAAACKSSQTFVITVGTE